MFSRNRLKAFRAGELTQRLNVVDQEDEDSLETFMLMLDHGRHLTAGRGAVVLVSVSTDPMAGP